MYNDSNEAVINMTFEPLTGIERTEIKAVPRDMYQAFFNEKYVVWYYEKFGNDVYYFRFIECPAPLKAELPPFWERQWPQIMAAVFPWFAG